MAPGPPYPIVNHWLPDPLGPIIRVEAMGQTTVPGVYAAGDAAVMMKSLSGAVASGYAVGAMVHQSLIPALPH